MARAKRTHRTEARRRYRAVRAEIEAAENEDADEPESESRSGSTAHTRSRPSSTASGGRLGIAAAFRAAMRPLDWRADVQELPRLARHWSLLVPVAASIASSVLFIAATASAPDAKNPPSDTLGTIAIVLYQFFVIPPPMAAAFLAGLGAPRASWLIGAIVGVVAAIGNTAIVLSPFGQQLYEQPALVIAQSFFFAPFGAALFASMAAWYRRFLNLANPNRSQQSAKPQRGRGNLPTNSRATASRRS